MKKKCLYLLVLAFLLVSCRAPQQRPMGENQTETNQSSIFRTTAVEHCRITADTVDVKDGIGSDFNTVGTLNRDDVVRVLDQVGDWYVIQMDNNQIGSIDAANATPVVREGDATDLPPDRDPEPTPNAEDTPSSIFGEDNPLPDRWVQPTPLKPEGQPEQIQPGALGEDIQQDRQRQQTTQDNRQAAQGNFSGQEQQMIQLINEERQKNGLSALQYDAEVARVAGVKSQDMVDNDYFSHYSPTYGSPFEMLDSFGVNYLHAGENLAGNSNVQNAHVALMNSSGHRQNILNTNFTHVGIGVRKSGRYGFVYTQMFISKPR